MNRQKRASLLLSCSAAVLLLAGSAQASEPIDKRINCSHAAVLAALSYNGIDTNLDSVIAEFPEHLRGETEATIGDVVAVLTSFRLDAKGVKLDMANASKDWEGSILLIQSSKWKPGHFVLLKEIGDNRAVLVDPTLLVEEKNLSFSVLAKNWSGLAIVIRPGGWSSKLKYLVFPVLLAVFSFLVVDYAWSRKGAS